MPEGRMTHRNQVAVRSDTGPPTIVFGVMLGPQLMAWPGRNQLMKSLTRHSRVILLQSSPEPETRLRSPRRPSLVELEDGLFVARCALDARTHRVGRRIAGLAAAIDGQWLRSELQRFDHGEPLLWLTVSDPLLARGFRGPLVYDCMDPNFLPEEQVDHDRRELPLARQADVVFSSARSLLERMLKVNPHSYLLPNAAPVAAASPSPRPRELEGRSGPIAGYLGTVDWRFDVKHVLAAANALPQVTFAIVGRVNADQKHRVAPLRTLPNVILPGQVDLAEGDSWVWAFDLGLIPFIPGPMNDAINPVKMYMYLRAGLPVVSTAVAECIANPWVHAATSHDDFVDAIRRAACESDPVLSAARAAYASVNTWDDRADAAVDILIDHGLWG